jgi:exodeoxyribonuclease VII large subunit
MVVAGLASRLADLMQGQIGERRVVLNGHRRALRHLSPQARLRNARQQVDDLLAAATVGVRHGLTLRRERLDGLSARLDSLSPVATLARGYAIVRQPATGTVVRSVAQVSPGDHLSVHVADGEFETTVD